MQDQDGLTFIKRVTATLPAMVLALSGTAAIGIAQLRPEAKPEVPLGVLVIGEDTAQKARIVAAADGRLVAYGGWLGAVVAMSDDPDFAARLYRAGATVVFRADGAVGCPGTPQATKRTL